MKLSRGYIDVAKDGADDSPAQILAAMIRDCGRAAIEMNEEAMAALLPRLDKPQRLQELDHPAGRDRSQTGHEGISTRSTAMNS